MRRLVIAAAGALVAFASLAPAHATIPAPTSCERMGGRNLLPSPLLLEVGANAASPTWWDEATLCIGTAGGSTDGAVYEEVDVAVHPYGTRGPAACNPGGDPNEYTGAHVFGSTSPGSNGASAEVGIWTAPQVCANGDGTYTVTVPVKVCSGACVTEGVPVGRTGLVVGTVKPEYSTGGGGASVTLTVVGTYLYVDGIQITFGPSRSDNVTVAPSNVTPQGAPLVCGPAGVCVPGSLGLRYGGGPVLGSVTVTGVGTFAPGLPLGVPCTVIYSTPGNPPC